MHEDERRIQEAMRGLEPVQEAVDRGEAVVMAGFAISNTPLAEEWTRLLIERPVRNGVTMVAAAALFAVVSPLGRLILSMLGAG